MLQDVKCPYCDEWQEINHDDGYGYEEDKVFTQECGKCNKTFIYTTSISFYYEASQAPCQNGEEHSLKDMNGYPKELFEYRKRCEWCDEEVIIDREKHIESRKNYVQRLDEERAKSQHTTKCLAAPGLQPVGPNALQNIKG